MLKNNDDFLYKLNQPLMMASDDDDDDDELFGDDSSEETSKEDVSDSDGDSAVASSSADSRNSTGITGSSIGFGLLALTGVLPLGLLVMYMTSGLGLSLSAMLFMVTFGIGLLLSIWTFIYYRSGVSNFTKFDVHSFFKWPEIITISIVLLGISFMNISNLSSGGAFSLSAESTVNASVKKPMPIYAPKPPQVSHFEENEVLYENSKEFSPVKGAKKTAKTHSTATQHTTTPVRSYVKPTHFERTVQSEKTLVNTNNNEVQVKKEPVAQTLAHEDEEGRTSPKGKATSNGKDTNQIIDEAVGLAQKSVANTKVEAPVVQKEVNTDPQNVTPAVPMEVETPLSSLFFGGILCAALGYAFAVALAGGILGLFRKFNHPFAAKTKEIINDETGEITLETEAQTMGSKILDYVFRFFIGFNIGGTAGFLLGLVITLPLYFMFWDKAQSEPMVANLIMGLGVVKNPDLAYGYGMVVAGLVVPLVMLVIGKSSPAGVSVTEETMRQVYSIPVTINKVSTDMTTIPEPAIISFDVDDDSDEEGVSVDDFSDDPKESITNDLISEFGLELENTFGMKVESKSNGNGNGHHPLTEFEKQKVNSVLENSLGELGNVTVQVSAELGKATIMLTDWLNLTEGTLIELDKPVSQEIDILINDVCKGKGKLSVVDNHLAVKVSKANFSQSKN